MLVIVQMQDGSPSSFSTNERATILFVWRSVSEDFAPFNVDVTTEDPALTNTPLEDWVRVAIGGSSSDCEQGLGGLMAQGLGGGIKCSEYRLKLRDKYTIGTVSQLSVIRGATRGLSSKCKQSLWALTVWVWLF